MRADIQKPKGAVLLLALLVMSGVLITGSSLGTIAIITLHQGKLIDDSINAFAAAESGAEQTLYQTRRLGVNSTTLNANPNDTSSASISGPPMGANGSWSRVLTSSEPSVSTNLSKDKSYELLLWNPDTPNMPPGIESLKYSWSDVCGGTSALEVIAVGWDPSLGGTSPFNSDITFHGTSPALTYIYNPAGIIDNSYIGPRAYRVRMRAKNCDIYNLTVTAWSADNLAGALVNLPSRVAVTSTGSYGTSRQALELRLPRLQPLTGAFDYVIFSQCSILKGVSGPACP